MDTLPSPWTTIFTHVRRPRMVLQGCIEFSSAWLFTRRWLVLAICLPVLIVILTATGITAFGNFLSEATLIKRYSELAQVEVKSIDELSGDATATTQGPKAEVLIAEEKVSKYGEILLRRLLQLQRSDTRATYLVAAQLGQSGRLSQARSMMRSLAPANSKGFAPAHAWLAVWQLRQGSVKPENLKTLMQDLEIACTWQGTGEVLIATYADLLEQQGQVSEALGLLDRISTDSPRLQLKLANMAYNHKRDKQLQEVSTRNKLRIEKLARAGDADAEDFAMLSNLFLLEKDTERAEKSALRGLQLDPENTGLKRLLSEAYRLQYLLTQQLSDEKTTINLALLDAALKSDPSNPAVGQEVAKLIASGASATPELQVALEQQIASGQSTALTHILLANRKLQDGEIAAAIPHLEVALRQAPGNPTALNNLALAIARTDPARLVEARELVDQAVAQVPDSAEYYDTQGEIRSLLADHHGAIESYEKVIGLDGNRVETRSRLAVEYEAVGLKELADLQRKIIAQPK